MLGCLSVDCRLVRYIKTKGGREEMKEGGKIRFVIKYLADNFIVCEHLATETWTRSLKLD